jgi:hypothetical protein
MAAVEHPIGLLDAAVAGWIALDRGWQAVLVATLVTVCASAGLQIPW